jgi:hypothetical protein
MLPRTADRIARSSSPSAGGSKRRARNHSCYLSSVSRLWIEQQYIAGQPFTQPRHVGTRGKLKPKEASNNLAMTLTLATVELVGRERGGVDADLLGHDLDDGWIEFQPAVLDTGRGLVGTSAAGRNQGDPDRYCPVVVPTRQAEATTAHRLPRQSTSAASSQASMSSWHDPTAYQCVMPRAVSARGLLVPG